MTEERLNQIRSRVAGVVASRGYGVALKETFELLAYVDELRGIIADNRQHICVCTSCEATRKALKEPKT